MNPNQKITKTMKRDRVDFLSSDIMVMPGHVERRDNYVSNHGFTVLGAMCFNGRGDSVDDLLKRGVDKDEMDDDGCTPLYFASGDITKKEIFEMLLRNNVDVNKGDFTPLTISARHGIKEFVVSLLGAGADVNKIDKFAWSPLYTACYKGHTDIVDILLNAGADTECVDKGGWTPLIVACFMGHHEIVDSLLRSGADKNKADREGWTPLFMASYRGFDSVVMSLLSFGVDMFMENIRGETPLSIAISCGHAKIITFIKEYMRDIATAIIAATESDLSGFDHITKHIIWLVVTGANDKNMVSDCHRYFTVI